MARIALDIDSTLHHYWDLIDRIARERYGVELPYEEQTDWGITLLERDQLRACVEETHSDENVISAEPYPGAVEAASEEWLRRIGMPYNDLHCSYDKVSRCVELGVHLLIDDSPANLCRARAE